MGADRIANAIAVTHLFPNENVIIIDLGTATTFCAISAQKLYMGGVIMAGMKMSMKALESGASKLGSVEIIERDDVLGKSTNESIQSGLFHGAKGAIKEIIAGLTSKSFKGKKPIIIGTGGFTSVFRNSNIFNEIIPDLVLKGLYLAHKINEDPRR